MTPAPPNGESVEGRFAAIWLYCMTEHEVGTLVSGPCMECVTNYAKTGPPARNGGGQSDG